MRTAPTYRLAALLGVGVLALVSVTAGTAASAAPAQHGNAAPARHRKAPKPPRPGTTPTASTSSTQTSTTDPATFSVGQMQGSVVGGSGCGTNIAGEPSLHVSKENRTVLGSEDGLGGGSQLWTGTQPGGAGASACGLTYRGQPNAVGGVGASGGDIDTAFAPAVDSAGTYRIYVASLNLASINVATSTDNGATFSQVPVQAGVPVDDREWIAAYGPDTSLLTYHDILTNNIDVLRSDTGGGPYTQISTAIPPTDYKASNNELGNIVIDHNRGTGTATSPFDAYQSFVAPEHDPGPGALLSGAPYNEAFLAVSHDGGHSFADQPIPCSVSSATLNHQFPNVSVAPNGTLVETWSDDQAVYAATSYDHGSTWSCTGPVSSNLKQAIEPWVVTTNAGTDLVFYGSPDTPGSGQRWYAYIVQAPPATAGAPAFGAPQQVTEVHLGPVCEGGVSCTTGRQLFDDFGVDTDQQGNAHIAFSHDAPDLGGQFTYTGYAVQTGGATVGPPN